MLWELAKNLQYKCKTYNRNISVKIGAMFTVTQFINEASCLAALFRLMFKIIIISINPISKGNAIFKAQSFLKVIGICAYQIILRYYTWKNNTWQIKKLFVFLRHKKLTKSPRIVNKCVKLIENWEGIYWINYWEHENRFCSIRTILSVMGEQCLFEIHTINIIK